MTAPGSTDTGLRPTSPSGRSWEGGGPTSGVREDYRVGLAEVLRGLSALFWGLPLALLAFARHFLAILPTLYDLVFPLASTGLALFGLWRMASYQRGERIWQRSLLVSQSLALVATGLSPFLFLWSRMPSVGYFSRAVVLLLAVSVLFLVALMGTLERLASMLPDDTIRGDARLFRGLATYVIAVLAGVSMTLYWRMAPVNLSEFLEIPRQPLGLGRHAILLLLILVPVAMSMAVTWKLKELVLTAVLARAGVMGAEGRPGSPGGKVER